MRHELKSVSTRGAIKEAELAAVGGEETAAPPLRARTTLPVRFWSRRTWMRLGVALAILYVGVDVAALVSPGPKQLAHELVEPARLGLAHVMATFACATFMRVGAARARFAPAYFLSGSVLFFLSRLVLLVGLPRLSLLLQGVGAGLLLVGWLVLAWAAAEVDSGAPAGPYPNS